MLAGSNSRQKSMDTAIQNIGELERKLLSRKCRIKTNNGVVAATDSAFKGAERWIGYTISEEKLPSYRQERYGRLVKESCITKTSQTFLHMSVCALQKNVDYGVKCDGLFPLVTNCGELIGGEILSKYKFQPIPDKSHEPL